jgi:beta-phosphoglucomutase family hydrolase
MLPWVAPAHTLGLIFDCDGTLADTMPIHFVAWTTALEAVGIEFSEDRFYALGGMSTERIVALLSEEQGIVINDIAELTAAKEKLYLASIDSVRPIDSVVAVARRYHGVLPLGVGSGGERYIVAQTLNAIGVADLFDAVVGADDTERHKPEPDVFLEVARRLGVVPSQCVVFEDTDLGMEAARRAGMIGVDIRPWRAQ